MNRLAALVVPLPFVLLAAACGSAGEDAESTRSEQALVRDIGRGNLPLALRTSVLTQHNDNARTGANLGETDLNTSNVNVRSFGKLHEYAVIGQVYAQPLYAPHVNGTKNAVFVATEENNVYALDADVPDKKIWTINLGTPVPSSLLKFDPSNPDSGSCGDLVPSIGITSTPVIDLGSRTIYLVAKTLETFFVFENGQTFRTTRQVYRLHARSIDDGTARPGSGIEIEAEVPGTGDGKAVVRFDASHQLQRPGLVLTHGRVYIGFGAHCDIDQYHGWVLGYDAKTLQQTGAFNTTPDGYRGGVWQAGAGIAANAAGDLFVTTGNGASDHDGPAPRNFSTSMIELHPASDGSLSVQSYFMPWNADELNGVSDADLGSGGPMLLPNTNLVLGGGKEGIYVTERQSALEGFVSSPTGKNFVQRFNAGNYRETGDQIFGGAAFWDGPTGAHLYVWPTAHPLLAFEYGVARRRLETHPHGPEFLLPPAEGALPDPAVVQYRGSSVSVSAWGKRAGTGIVWTVSTLVGGGGKTRLSAFDASNIGKLLWTSDDAPERDRLGGFSKYVAPTIVDGRVFMPTTYGANDGRIMVYGLDPAPLADAGAPDAAPEADACGVVGDPPPSGDWSELFETYLKSGFPATNLGHCGNCHGGPGIKSFSTGDNSSTQTCEGLKKSILFAHDDGGVDLSKSIIADPAKTLLVWFGGPAGRMPPYEPASGLPAPTCNARAAAAVSAWVAKGAPCPLP